MRLFVKELPTTSELDIDVQHICVVQDALRDGKFSAQKLFKVSVHYLFIVYDCYIIMKLAANICHSEV